MKKIALILSTVMLFACGEKNLATHEADEHSEAATEYAKGPHRGRLLMDGDFGLEVTIFESGVPPEFHLYATQNGKSINPGDVKATIQLTRLGGKVSEFRFSPESDYLKSHMPVAEPHSFDVNISAEYAGKKHVWNYSSYEGRTTIASDMAAAAGVKTAVAGPGVLRETLSLYGSIRTDAQRVRSVNARFPGPIRQVHKQLGDSVKTGDVLATVESNESLQTYAITSPIAGIVTARHANAGETAASEPLFVISDYSRVWAEFNLFARDRSKVKIGQRVMVSATDGEQHAEGKVDFIAASDDARHQSLLVRVSLDNNTSLWTPGLYVNGIITIGEKNTALVVRNSGLQTFRDFTVVFAQVGDTYEVRMLELGASDGEYTEVLGGLDAGTTYVSENSYLIKADIEKSGASHDH
ncbi:MAG: efflux RND transporter periplasmic adaptor subunit [Spongiibacteraceae bacterium]